MTADDLILNFNNDPDIIETNTKGKKRIVITIRKEAILKMGIQLIRELKFRFITASAFESKSGIEILYHFSEDGSGLMASLHVLLVKDNPEIESLAYYFEAFNWIEKEMHELLGIQFKNHPEPGKLISDGNWEEGIYPFRKNGKMQN